MAVDRAEANQGDTVRLQILFTLSDVAFDPHEVRLVEILDANLNLLATISGSDIVRETIGQFHADWPIPSSEPATIHYDKWYATAQDGGTEKVFTNAFQVLTFAGSSSTTPYMTVAEARDFIPIVTGITDSQLSANIAIAQEIIEMITGVVFQPYQDARIFHGSGKPVLSIRRPIQSVSEVRVLSCDSGGTSFTIDVDTIRIDPARTMLAIGNVVPGEARFYGPQHYPWQTGHCGVFPYGFSNIEVSGLWGAYPAVPSPIKRALGQLLRHALHCDDPLGLPAAAHKSEATDGDTTYELRQIFSKASVDNVTGYPDVDTVLALYNQGIVISVV